jgi:hypothetical protein
MQEWNPSTPRDPYAANQQEEQSKQKQVKSGWLEWWYRLATPPETAKPQRRAERDKARRIRLSSTLLLIITVIWLAAIPVFLITVSSDPTTIPITFAGLAVIALLLFFNRQGWVAGVAWLLIGMIDLSVVLILMKEGKLNTGDVAILDLMVYTELIAVSILPAINVFLVALSNCAFILVLTFIARPSADAFSQPAFLTNLLIEPITLQLFVAVVTYLWVASTERAMARADQAELVASLERRRGEERHQLEDDIQHLMETLTRAANGDSSARASINQDHALWQISRSLNMLLARVQRVDQSEQTLHHLDVEVSLVLKAIQENKTGRFVHWPAPSGSLLDPIIRELASAQSSTGSSHQ